MIFDDSFFQLTGNDDDLDDVSLDGSDIQWSEDENSENAENNENKENIDSTENGKNADSEIAAPTPMIDFDPLDLSGNPGEKWSSEYGNPDFDYVIESDIVMPKIKPVKNETSVPLVMVIDDDFDTLDLMKIYFARGYEYVSFSGPREAIFYLNEHVPDLIFLDCYIHTIKAARVVEIIHLYKELADVPIIYLCEDYEYGAIYSKIPKGVNGLIKRPVSRRDIQAILDKYIKKEE